MIRAVLDTNTIVSGVGWGGPRAAVLDAALAAIVVTPTNTVELVRDPDDDRLIEAALAAEADVIATGDQDLLTLERIDHLEDAWIHVNPTAHADLDPHALTAHHRGPIDPSRREP